MASIAFYHVGYITSIAPNVTQHWWWNNAAAQRVWSFSVDAMVPLSPPPIPGATAKIQITEVEYREIYSGGQSFEKEVHFWIKNTGSISANFAVHMAVVQE
jgi:hypothetical protein